MPSIKSMEQGFLYPKQKLLRIGAQMGVDDMEGLIVRMYEGGMSTTEIAEDFAKQVKSPTVTNKTIRDYLYKQERIQGRKIIRNKRESFNLAIQKGRRTFELKANKYKRIGISTKLRYEILQRDGFKCVCCGSRDQLEIDHIKAVSDGGGNENENLQTLCWACNRGKFEVNRDK